MAGPGPKARSGGGTGGISPRDYSDFRRDCLAPEVMERNSGPLGGAAQARSQGGDGGKG